MTDIESIRPVPGLLDRMSDWLFYHTSSRTKLHRLHRKWKNDAGDLARKAIATAIMTGDPRKVHNAENLAALIGYHIELIEKAMRRRGSIPAA